jgi:hypothetical protein
MTMPGGIEPKSHSKWKLLRDLILLAALVWAGFRAWAYFKFKVWMGGFGIGAFWVAGLLTGFVYFYSAYKWEERIKSQSGSWKKAGSFVLFGSGLLFVNPITVSLALWAFTPPGNLHLFSFWFFFGSALAGGIVIVLERLFTKKALKP